jgi:DMSO reductase anchor subunit
VALATRSKKLRNPQAESCNGSIALCRGEVSLHPAASIIAFTTLTGMGYGLLALIGVLAPLGTLPLARAFGASSLGLALVFITAGLLSSTLHLGHPERAWRAFSQWRSSWLSREGVAALATYVPALLFAGLWWLGATAMLWSVLGFLTAAASVATVICTAMIYHSLKPIRQWRSVWVVPNYLILAATTGALWLLALLAMFGQQRAVLSELALALVLAAAAMKVAYWRSIDTEKAQSTIASATGLAGGALQPLDPPHTEENYLLKEMGYRIGRRHARKLRGISIALGFCFPLLTLSLATLLGASIASTALMLAGAIGGAIGVLIERWLFFSQATHTVTLFYRG